MKTTQPRRLIDDPAMPAELRQDLEQAASASFNYDVGAGLAILHVTLGNNTPSQPPPAKTGLVDHTGTSAASSSLAHGAGLSLTVKVGLAITGAVLATGVVIGLQTRSPEVPARRAAPGLHAQAPAAMMAAVPSPSDPPQVPAAQETKKTSAPLAPVVDPGAPKATARRQAAAHKSTAATAQPSDNATDLRREIAELAQIKAMLPSDPGAAYRLASAGHVRFGHGMLYPEREAMAVLALSAMRRDNEANARGQRFIQQYPDSPMRARVEAAVGSHGVPQGSSP